MTINIPSSILKHKGIDGSAKLLCALHHNMPNKNPYQLSKILNVHSQGIYKMKNHLTSMNLW